ATRDHDLLATLRERRRRHLADPRVRARDHKGLHACGIQAFGGSPGMHIRTLLISAIASLSLAACGGGKKPADTTTTTTANKSLYDRLGGQDAIKAVVKDFVEENVAKDPRINARFANSDIPHLEQMLTEQICQASGGPCKYSGKDM